ncbi:hypothetical protein AGMMS50248_04610 [Deltaproteobacteria bacterium]|nr:hypothetical protein AGMMS50248_04610 [Deltaproteobacteria bacterium]
MEDLIQLLALADMWNVLKEFGERDKRTDPVIHFYATFLSARHCGKNAACTTHRSLSFPGLSVLPMPLCAKSLSFRKGLPTTRNTENNNGRRREFGFRRY